MTIINHGRLDWGGGRDMELHRTYWVKFLLETDDDLDGPQTLTFGPSLPVIGASWTYGNENDAYALCYPLIDCETVVKNEKNFWWVLKYTFSTKPWIACATATFGTITTPLTQPDTITGSFVNYQERTCRRRRGDTGTGTGEGPVIVSSSLEPIWVTKDKNRPTVSIQQTRLNLELGTFSSMLNTLNDATLWGMPPRCVKLRNVPWRRLVWGLCTFYYQRTLEFDISYDSFDLVDLRDQGHRVLDKKKLAANPYLDRTNPDNFERCCDEKGNVNKVVLLNGRGEMCSDPTSHFHYIDKVELYEESNFLTLGVPATL
jgi:hypothetical protein